MARRLLSHLAVAGAITACGGGDEPQVPTVFAPPSGSTTQVTGVVASNAASAPQVQILDAKGRGIRGLRVRWRVGPNSGGVGNDSTVTDASGVALSGGWTLGTAAGVQTLTASADGVSPVVFTAQVAPGQVANLVPESQDGQQATVNTTVAQPPSLRAQDVFGNPVPGVAVTFTVTSGGGTIDAAPVTTNANGIATATSWRLGTTAGAQSARATALTATPALFTALALPGPADNLVKIVGDNQQGIANSPTAIAPGVRVVDAFGNAIGGIPVTFTPGPSSGTVTSGTSASDPANGTAFVGSWILGTAPAQTLVATSTSLLGKSVTFNATALSTLFDIDVRFIGSGGTARQRLAFSRAANKWRSVIVGQVHTVAANAPSGECRPWIPAIAETINDLVIFARIVDIDGVNGVLGQASVCYLGSQSNLPVVGFMEFDQADLPSLENSNVIDDVVLHEMGHVLGVGTLWSFRGFVSGAGTSDPIFTGAGARTQFTAANTLTYTGPIVPIHNEGPPGRREAHWRFPLFGSELMNPFAQSGGMPLSRITAASLADMGYTVNLAATDPYSFSAASISSPFRSAPISLENDVPKDVIIRVLKPDGTRPPVVRQP